ncbi:MAG: tubulin/FtsZ family protein [Methanoregula sp.]|nr:tubulin/FtsZ family protein [Methanoregula sp.]
MRIIAIGVGGAGCRIVDNLYAMDRKSSKVVCVHGLAVDVDEETIKLLTGLPENARMCFSALDAGIPDRTGTEQQTATIDIAEIVSRVQNLESGENDAIFLCCGLGGSMTDIAPHIIAGLRSSVIEPIFGLVTLPCLAEGERISGKAADDIEMLSSLLDGIIVFDNETWHKKIKAQIARLPAKEMGFAEKIGLKKSEKPLPQSKATYRNLNEAIVRRIGLILRAGEFRADGGVDLAEVVLDSGEVLNTMKGMGFITIGYAVEKLPHDPLRFLSWLKPAGLFNEEQKKKASRIVELAKQAIYHEISTPCDLTSAHKALVLIAGPSHELSMKGYMTVRKWIDRSIAGLETRSGDYPVVNTKNVAIIVMLSGLENIPRITELKEIRSQSKPKMPSGSDVSPAAMQEREIRDLRDDMITLPARKSLTGDAGRSTSGSNAPRRSEIPVPETEPGHDVETAIPERPHHAAADAPFSAPSRRTVPVPVPGPEPEDTGIQVTPTASRRRVVVAHTTKEHPHEPSPLIPTPQGIPRTSHAPGLHKPASAEGTVRRDEENIHHSRETERQRIERELRRQRSLAVSGHAQKIPEHTAKSHSLSPETHIVQRNAHKEQTGAQTSLTQKAEEIRGALPEEKRTVIIGKRKISAVQSQKPDLPAVPERPDPASPAESGSSSDDDGMSVEVREQEFQARDEVFRGKGIRKPAVPHARDSALLHTKLRPKQKIPGDETENDEPRDNSAPVKKRTKQEEKDQDLSWI